MARVLKPPSSLVLLPTESLYGSVFLAGSIEMGKATNWQAQVEQALVDVDAVVFNPRRDDWDSTWEQSINNPNFKGQVDWELDALEAANFIAMYLEPGTMSPISLLELGLFANSSKLIVCCPQGFWRKGNVDILCARHNIRQVDTLEELIALTTAIVTTAVNNKL
jgi:hypothetical protein